jgi:hypothetical protein
MKGKEMRARITVAVEEGIKQYFLQVEHTNGELTVGGVVLSAPGKLKLRVVDKDYRPFTYIITIAEGER